MLKKLWYYERRNNRKKIVFIGLTIVACLTVFMAIDVLVATIERGIAQEVKPVVGGDIVIRNSSALTIEQLDRLITILDRYDAEYTYKVEFFTNMPDTQDRQVLVKVVGIDALYPFFGIFSYTGWGITSDAIDQINTVNTVRVIADAMVIQEHVQEDGTIPLGSKNVSVTHRLEQFPENSFSFFSDGRMVVVDHEVLSGTNLTDIGSRVSHEYLIRVSSFDRVATVVKILRDDPVLIGLQIRDYSSSIGQISSITSDFYTYLYMIVVMAFVLAGLSIFFMVETYMLEEGKRFGIMKMFGLTNQSLFGMVGIGFLVVYIVSFLLSIALVQAVHLFQPYIPLQQPIILGLHTYVKAMVVGVLVVGLSLGIPLFSFVYKHPLDCIKITLFSPKSWKQQLIYGIIIWVMIVLMLFVSVGQLVSAVVFASVGMVSAGIIGGILYMLLLWVYRVAKLWRKKAFLWYDVVRGMVRPGSMSLLTIGSLWVVTTILFVLIAVFYAFEQRLALADEEQPNLFILNLKTEDISRISGYQEDDFFSVILGRIIAINGRPLREHLQGSTSNEFSREFNITTSILRDDPIVAGKKNLDANEVSVARDFARRLGVTIGDTIEFFIAGRSFVLTIVSEREIQTDGTTPFFFFQLPREQFVQAPKTYFIPVRISSDGLEAYKNDLIQRIGPHVSFVDVSEISQTIRQVSNDIRIAVTLLCSIILLFIIAVMFATNIRMRQYKAYKLGLYELLGITRVQQQRLTIYEYIYQASFACVWSVIAGVILTVIIISSASVLRISIWGNIYAGLFVIGIYGIQVLVLYSMGTVKARYISDV